MLAQVERALLMHSTGYLIEDNHPFSEKYWGHWTTIYIKLARELSDSQWNSLYESLEITEGINKKMSEFSKPVECWTDNPDDYHIVASDPPEAE